MYIQLYTKTDYTVKMFLYNNFRTNRHLGLNVDYALTTLSQLFSVETRY